jgi:hypothetical protein
VAAQRRLIARLSAAEGGARGGASALAGKSVARRVRSKGGRLEGLRTRAWKACESNLSKRTKVSGIRGVVVTRCAKLPGQGGRKFACCEAQEWSDGDDGWKSGVGR